jgi:RNA ligase (TIGR02306 family)
MAELKVEVVKIDDVTAHPNADRMELAFVGGYQVCVQLGAFISGDTAVYIPVDSILPEKLEAFIFGVDAKVKLHKHRVRLIKLRKAQSHGMLMTINDVLDYFNANRIVAGCVVGDDLTDVLGVTKYQPPVKDIPQGMNTGKNKAAAWHNNPLFSKYTNINHLRKYVEALEGQDVYITEKIHGTNFRCGWVPFVPRTFLQKLKNILGLNKSHEFVYGSHNVQLQNKGGKNAFSDNVYKRVVKYHRLKEKIAKGHLWMGEIFGSGIQKGYEYGLKDGFVDVAFMDIKVIEAAADSYYMNFAEVVEVVESVHEQVVPYSDSRYNFDLIVKQLNDKNRRSLVDNKTKPIEGFVVRPIHEQSFYGGRLILKLLSDAYLLNKDNTEWK